MIIERRAQGWSIRSTENSCEVAYLPESDGWTWALVYKLAEILQVRA